MNITANDKAILAFVRAHGIDTWPGTVSGQVYKSPADHDGDVSKSVTHRRLNLMVAEGLLARRPRDMGYRYTITDKGRAAIGVPPKEAK